MSIAPSSGRDTGDDLAELVALIAARRARMVAIAFRVLRDEQDAEDAVQDACLQSVRRLDRFDRRSQLATWLHRVVVNTALMRLRARTRRAGGAYDDVDTLADDTSNVETIVHRRQLQAFVRRSLAEIEPRHRVVLVLRDVEERDPAEVAAALRVTPNALKVRAYRARKAMRVRLSALAGDDPSTEASARHARLRAAS
jgi:RNA polymerase sigma-70 factor, ECF subfamily